MITEASLRRVDLLSETLLYDAACAFIADFRQAQRKTLPESQLHGLHDIIQAENYQQLKKYMGHQQLRSWSHDQEYIKTFYKNLEQRITQVMIDALKDMLAKDSALTLHDRPELEMLLAREFIQHLIAEHNYWEATNQLERSQQRADAPHGARPPQQQGRR